MQESDEMTPAHMKKAREQLGLTQDGLGRELGKSERFITYRESSVQKIDTMTKYAIFWLLIPKFMRKRFINRFFG